MARWTILRHLQAERVILTYMNMLTKEMWECGEGSGGMLDSAIVGWIVDPTGGKANPGDFIVFDDGRLLHLARERGES